MRACASYQSQCYDVRFTNANIIYERLKDRESLVWNHTYPWPWLSNNSIQKGHEWVQFHTGLSLSFNFFVHNIHTDELERKRGVWEQGYIAPVIFVTSEDMSTIYPHVLNHHNSSRTISASSGCQCDDSLWLLSTSFWKASFSLLLYEIHSFCKVASHHSFLERAVSGLFSASGC